MDMANEIKQLNAGKQESERKRKQADSNLAELTLRLAEIERSSGDQQNKVSKLQVRERVKYAESFKNVLLERSIFDMSLILA